MRPHACNACAGRCACFLGRRIRTVACVWHGTCSLAAGFEPSHACGMARVPWQRDMNRRMRVAWHMFLGSGI
eukprot:366260-Chlamydomonas_euryale.AAC.21